MEVCKSAIFHRGGVSEEHVNLSHLAVVSSGYTFGDK